MYFQDFLNDLISCRKPDFPEGVLSGSMGKFWPLCDIQIVEKHCSTEAGYGFKADF